MNENWNVTIGCARKLGSIFPQRATRHLSILALHLRLAELVFRCMIGGFINELDHLLVSVLQLSLECLPSPT